MKFSMDFPEHYALASMIEKDLGALVCSAAFKEGFRIMTSTQMEIYAQIFQGFSRETVAAMLHIERDADPQVLSRGLNGTELDEIAPMLEGLLKATNKFLSHSAPAFLDAVLGEKKEYSFSDQVSVKAIRSDINALRKELQALSEALREPRSEMSVSSLSYGEILQTVAAMLSFCSLIHAYVSDTDTSNALRAMTSSLLQIVEKNIKNNTL